MPNNNPLEKAVNLGQLQMAYEAGALLPVDISTLTPASTFPKNAVIGIGGVIYRAKRATASMPLTMVVSDGKFVIHEVNGQKAFVVQDMTVNADWDVWMDAGLSYAYSLADQRITALETETYTSNGKQYTRQQLLQAVADLMEKTLVTQ